MALWHCSFLPKDQGYFDSEIERQGIYMFDKWWLAIVNFRYQPLDLEAMEMWSEVPWKCNMCVEDYRLIDWQEVCGCEFWKMQIQC